MEAGLSSWNNSGMIGTPYFKFTLFIWHGYT